MSKTFKVAIFEAGNFNDPHKSVKAFFAKDGRAAITKARRYMTDEVGFLKYGPKLSYKVVDDATQETEV